MKMLRLLFLASVVLVTGCTLGPNYVRAPDDVPASFSAPAGLLPVLSTTPWWLSLHDPLLNELVARARHANPDIGRAQAAVAEARASLDQAEAGGRPQLNATGSANYGRAFTAPGYYGQAGGYGTAGFDASWELDLWGKDRRIVESASANAEAAQADADDAVLTLLGDVARDYVELRGIQARIAATQESVDNQRRANELAMRRFTGGDGSKLEVLQGSTLLTQRQAELPMLQSEMQVRVNAISTLCGDPPETLTAMLTPPGAIPQGPVPDAGIPADLLRRRPDVRVAERQLAATIPLIGAAMAEQYPSLSLSGTLSLSGSNVGSMFASPLFALSPTIGLPLLDGGQREAMVNIRRAQAEQSRYAYRTAVLKALREVEDAIARLRGETLHRDQLRQTVITAQKVVDTARTLYAGGATEFLQVLDAQRALNDTRDALAQAEAGRTIQVVALFKALGGGWEVSETAAKLASR